MKREIKFRAWDKLLHKMFYDISFIPVIDSYTYSIYENKTGKYFASQSELMQFTGLKDKNGKEIYADDILSDGKIKFRIYNIDGGFVIKESVWATDLNDFKWDDDLICESLSNPQTKSYFTETCEVIGNIYENPELL